MILIFTCTARATSIVILRSANRIYVGADSRSEPVYTARTLIHVRAHRPVLLYDNLGVVPVPSVEKTQELKPKDAPTKLPTPQKSAPPIIIEPKDEKKK